MVLASPLTWVRPVDSTHAEPPRRVKARANFRCEARDSLLIAVGALLSLCATVPVTGGDRGVGGGVQRPLGTTGLSCGDAVGAPLLGRHHSGVNG